MFTITYEFQCHSFYLLEETSGFRTVNIKSLVLSPVCRNALLCFIWGQLFSVYILSRPEGGCILSPGCSPSFCFVPCPTYHPALNITVLVTASLGAECKCNWPCFINSMSGSQEERKKNKNLHQQIPIFDIPLMLITYLCCFRV